MPQKYAYARFLVVQFYFILCARFGWSKYTIPELRLEAFSPKGFRVSIPDEDGLKRFAFHGRLNGGLSELEPGEFTEDVTVPTKGRWVYENPNIELHVGDTIGYWVFVQHNLFGYRKDNLTWRVEELIDEEKRNSCPSGITTVNGEKSCKGDLIFEDKFDLPFDGNKWIVEQYIPLNGPNYEFCYYSPEAVKVHKSKLIITPVPKQNEEEIRGILDLNIGCTSLNPNECYYKQRAAQYLPPVKSGKIKSKLSFKYGQVEIDAKLPCGDWIYPELSIIPKDDTKTNKFIVAYARGNNVLHSFLGEDIGGRLLFSGFSSSSKEPQRSETLSSKRAQEPYCLRSHTFKMIWNADEILSYVDDQLYGQKSHEFHGSEHYISLGVSVGGNNDFPEQFKSTNGTEKPWHNWDVRELKDFFTARNIWLPTWVNNALEVDSVRVYAV